MKKNTKSENNIHTQITTTQETNKQYKHIK